MNSQNGVSCVSSLWKEYSKTKDIVKRNKLIEAYLWIVRNIAKNVKANCPNSVELEDLVSAGVFGLMDAIKTFDPSLGTKFETYCPLRIRGAILDELRKMDWVPRLVRSHVKQYKLVKESLSNGNGHVPNLQEIADFLEVSIEEAERIQNEGNAPIIHLNEMVNVFMDGQKDFSDDMIQDKKAVKPEQELSKNDGFNELILCLNDMEQVVVTLYHRDDYQLRKIGEVLGLSESRVSQMYSGALQKIKDSLSL